MSNATIVPAEATHFGNLAADWWNPNGSSAMLHRLNPVRLGYVRTLSAAQRLVEAETQMRVLEGQTRSYSENSMDYELAFIFDVDASTAPPHASISVGGIPNPS